MQNRELHPDLSAEIREGTRRLNRLTGILILAGGMAGLVPISLWWLGILKFELVLAGFLLLFALLIVHSNLWAKHDRWVRSQLNKLDIDLEQISDLDSVLANIDAQRDSAMDKEIHGVDGAMRYRTRGRDEKGPDWGRSDSHLSANMPRRDAIQRSHVYEGMEGPVTEGEKIVAEVDEIQSEIAQQKWEESEAKDPDLIEAGVERLGDLVAVGHLELSAKEGAFADAVGLEREMGGLVEAPIPKMDSDLAEIGSDEEA